MYLKCSFNNNCLRLLFKRLIFSSGKAVLQQHWKRLTHWGRVTHICVSKQAIIYSDNGLSPGRRRAIIGTNAGILLIRTVGTNFSEIVSEIHTFSLKKMRLKISSAKWRPCCLGLDVLCSIGVWILNKRATSIFTSRHDSLFLVRQKRRRHK